MINPVQLVQTTKATHLYYLLPQRQVFYNAFHPDAALCQNIPSLLSIQKGIQELKQALKKLNIQHTDIRQVLKLKPDLLRQKCLQVLQYRCKPQDKQTLKKFMDQQYKRKCVSQMEIQSLLQILFKRPVLHLIPTQINTFCKFQKIQVNPVTNAVFARDSQIVTPKGIVMSRLRTQLRNRQVQIYQLAWQILGFKPIGKIPLNQDRFLQGGDYMTIKSDLALCGVGMRSNQKACQYLMQNDLLGTSRFGIVQDRNDQSQQRMHLDTYFNLVDQKTALLLDFNTVPESKQKDIKRYVKLYKQNIQKKYIFQRQIQFEQLLIEEGFRIIPVTHQQQLEYLINFIIIDKNNIITGNKNLQKKLKDHKVQINVISIDFEGINRMYGSVHCATQIFRN